MLQPQTESPVQKLLPAHPIKKLLPLQTYKQLILFCNDLQKRKMRKSFKTLPDILPVRASRKTRLVKEHEKVKAATKTKFSLPVPHTTQKLSGHTGPCLNWADTPVTGYCKPKLHRAQT